MVVDADGSASAPDGSAISADENGKVDLTAAAEPEVVMTKTVSIKVSGDAPTQTAYVLGDVDMDGKIRSKDARLALRAAAKLDVLDGAALLLADVNEDGNVRANDARAILRIAAQLDPKPEKTISVPV